MLYRKLLRPLLFKLPPETAHELALHALTLSLGTKPLRRAASRRFGVETFGEIRRFGLSFKNPVGLAAGFDKNGVAARELAALGFGFIEVGTVTALAQPGNPKPRLFRLPKDHALINRMGFNNAGAEAMCARLLEPRRTIVGVNLGKSKVTPEEQAAGDYERSAQALVEHA